MITKKEREAITIFDFETGILEPVFFQLKSLLSKLSHLSWKLAGKKIRVLKIITHGKTPIGNNNQVKI